MKSLIKQLTLSHKARNSGIENGAQIPVLFPIWVSFAFKNKGRKPDQQIRFLEMERKGLPFRSHGTGLWKTVNYGEDDECGIIGVDHCFYLIQTAPANPLK